MPMAKTRKRSANLTVRSKPAKTPPVRSDSSLEVEIGLEVRRLRKSLGLTVAEVGAAAHLSSGMLSKIENGAISPSLASLKTLAKSLNVSISHFFRVSEEQPDCSFVKAETGVRISRRGTKAGHIYNLLVSHSVGKEAAIEPYLITLGDDATTYTNFHHGGHEFIFMLAGCVKYRHGDRVFLLEKGDALFFNARTRHGPEEFVKSPIRYLSIVIDPRSS
jgi:transcriptional regulator with XRE-family HTH domain